MEFSCQIHFNNELIPVTPSIFNPLTSDLFIDFTIIFVLVYKNEGSSKSVVINFICMLKTITHLILRNFMPLKNFWSK